MLPSLAFNGLYVREASSSDYASELHPIEERAVRRRGLSERRMQEFRAGRACARDLLEALGHRRYGLLKGSNGEPLWPTGIVGSITHCSGYCAAVAASSSVFSGLGVDAEALSEENADLLHTVATKPELEDLGRISINPAHLATLIFSAKESIYKAIFYTVMRLVDFHEVRISLDFESCTFTARSALDDRLSAPLASLRGRFLVTTSHVLTLCALFGDTGSVNAANAPPTQRSLVQPLRSFQDFSK